MKYFGFKENIGYGFYEEIFNDAVEISDDEWQKLLEDQSNGKDIVMYNGKVFSSDANIYYLDASGHFKKRTNDEIIQLTEIENINATTNNALNFLNDTDWKVVRHRDQIAMGIETSLREEEYNELLKERQIARDSVIRLESSEGY